MIRDLYYNADPYSQSCIRFSRTIEALDLARTPSMMTLWKCRHMSWIRDTYAHHTERESTSILRQLFASTLIPQKFSLYSIDENPPSDDSSSPDEKKADNGEG